MTEQSGDASIALDEALATTRSVRRRLDLTRPVARETLLECLRLALQAPTASNRQDWHFVLVTDAQQRAALARIYRKAFVRYRRSGESAGALFAGDETRRTAQERVMRSAEHLAEHLHEVPAMLVPCLDGRWDRGPTFVHANRMGAILPAVWSFMLAARARGLGTVLTTLHLEFEREAAEVLGIPYTLVTQCALVPVAHVIGDPFRPAARQPVDQAVHWDRW